jgi:hypothetical protein
VRSYESRIAKLEQALMPEALIVYCRRFGRGELRGLSCSHPAMPYFERGPKESEEAFRDRATAQAEKWGGLVVLSERRGDSLMGVGRDSGPDDSRRRSSSLGP